MHLMKNVRSVYLTPVRQIQRIPFFANITKVRFESNCDRRLRNSGAKVQVFSFLFDAKRLKKTSRSGSINSKLESSVCSCKTRSGHGSNKDPKIELAVFSHASNSGTTFVNLHSSLDSFTQRRWLSARPDSLIERIQQERGCKEDDAANEYFSCSLCKAQLPRSPIIACNNCGTIVQPWYKHFNENGYSYFNLLQLTPGFDIDAKALDEQHKQLQKKLHPDTNLQAGEDDRKRLEEHRKQLMLAFATLKCPAKRALHLLQHHFNYQTKMDEENSRISDTTLLVEILELNEELEKVRTRDELDAFETKIRNCLKSIEKSLAEKIHKKQFEEIEKLAQRYKMHARLGERIKDWSVRS